MLRKFIERPVLSTVISIILLLLGIVSLTKLPVTQFPDIAPPSVSVVAFYPGAGAEVVARAVATPIEEAINGVEDMTYMTSTSNNDGSMSLNIFFKLGTDPGQSFGKCSEPGSKSCQFVTAGSNSGRYHYTKAAKQYDYHTCFIHQRQCL